MEEGKLNGIVLAGLTDLSNIPLVQNVGLTREKIIKIATVIYKVVKPVLENATLEFERFMGKNIK